MERHGGSTQEIGARDARKDKVSVDISGNISVKQLALRMIPASFIDALWLLRSHRLQQQRVTALTKKNKEIIESVLLQSSRPIQIELGAGKRRKEGWISIDTVEQSDICLDLSLPIPFPDDSVAQLYSSHLLEHFSYPQPLMSLLTECYRILQPGGLFRASVPNARIYLQGYLSPGKFNTEYYCRYEPAFHYISRIDCVNYIAYMAGHHRYMFDEENLQLILSKAGFVDVRLREFDPDLDLEARAHESIYVQGAKPLGVV